MSNIGGKSFSSVKKAREALRGRAEELLQEFIDTIRAAKAAGKYEEALKAQQWLLDHIPAEDGERLLDPSSDKPKPQIEGPKGPLVSMNFELGGVKRQKSIQESVIDVTPIDTAG